MNITEQNIRIAKSVVTLLASENCTVKQAEEIMSFVGRTISETSTVQFPKDYFSRISSNVTISDN